MFMKGKHKSKKASVIILTGFLGAGKTTLLNRLLTANHGRRIAVIVNEFGEVGIDHHLLLAPDQEVVQMNNGCICCTVKGDLVGSLFQLIERRSQFDTIVIETTGLAEPAPVAQSLYADERLRREFSLAGVVTVVDAKNITKRLADSGEAESQVAFADLILLNKTDLAQLDQLDEIEEIVARVNKLAKIIRTRNSELDLKEIFDLEAGGLAARYDVNDGHNDCHDYEQDHKDHEHNHDHGHHNHRHLQNIDTVSIVQAGELDHLRVGNWFRGVIAEKGSDILRMKGILNLRGDADQFLLQGVHADFEAKPGRPWKGNEPRLNRLVFIGRRLDKTELINGFSSCLATPGETARIDTVDPFGRYVEISPLTLEQIRFWLRQNFSFTRDTPIVIKEVPCVKPGCPPIETAILAILKNEPSRNFKVQRPINEITFDHIYDLMENPMPCC